MPVAGWHPHGHNQNDVRPVKTVLTRIAVGVAAAAVILLVTVDMGGRRQPDDGRLHIRYWTIIGMKEIIPYFAQSFGTIQNRVVVETTPIPWQEHEKKILTSIVSGNPPDVVNQITPVAKWASRLALVPLDEYIRRDNFDSTVFFRSLWDEMRYRGRIYGIPVYSGSYALFYNKALFREAGLDPDRPPQTWEDVFALNGRFVKRDVRGRILRMGFIPNYGNIQAFMLMAWQRGACFLSADEAQIRVADSTVVEALQWIQRFYGEYAQRDIAAFLGGLGFADQHGFISGKVAMMILDSSFPDQIRAYKPALDYGVAMIPTFPGRPTASVSGSWWLGIPRGAKHPEEAWEFIKHAVTRESQLLEIEKTEESLFPANRLAAEDPRFMTTPERKVFVRMMEYSHSPSVVPLVHDVFWREIVGAQERVIHGLQSPDAALGQAEKQIQAVLNDARDYDLYVHTHAEGR